MRSNVGKHVRHMIRRGLHIHRPELLTSQKPIAEVLQSVRSFNIGATDSLLIKSLTFRAAIHDS